MTGNTHKNKSVPQTGTRIPSAYEKKIKPGILLTRAFIYLLVAAVIAIIAAIVVYLVGKGVPHITLDILTTAPSRLDRTWGIAPMIFNTLYIVILTLLICIPLGIGTAIYLAEYARQGILVRALRFTIEILAGIPSIVYGLFGLVFIVRTLKIGSFAGSQITGAITCAIIVLPVMIRATEEALKQVNVSYREAALSMGVSKLYIIRTVLLPCAMSGITVAVILSIGRIISESAALIYTAGLSYDMPSGLTQHIAQPGTGLTVQLYFYIVDPQGAPEELKYIITAVLLIVVFLLNLSAYIISKFFKRKVGGK